MVRYNGFDSSDNATVGDFVASLIFRLLISTVLILGIILTPVYNIKCLIVLFYLIYISFNIIPIAKSIKNLYWDNFVEDNKKVFSNTTYYRLGFQIVETVINFTAILLLFFLAL